MSTDRPTPSPAAIMTDAITIAQAIWPKCDIGPSDEGWCCIMHEDAARNLLLLIARVALNPRLWL